MELGRGTGAAAVGPPRAGNPAPRGARSWRLPLTRPPPPPPPASQGGAARPPSRSLTAARLQRRRHRRRTRRRRHHRRRRRRLLPVSRFRLEQQRQRENDRLGRAGGGLHAGGRGAARRGEARVRRCRQQRRRRRRRHAARARLEPSPLDAGAAAAARSAEPRRARRRSPPAAPRPRPAALIMARAAASRCGCPPTATERAARRPFRLLAAERQHDGDEVDLRGAPRAVRGASAAPAPMSSRLHRDHRRASGSSVVATPSTQPHPAHRLGRRRLDARGLVGPLGIERAERRRRLPHRALAHLGHDVRVGGAAVGVSDDEICAAEQRNCDGVRDGPNI